MVSIGQKYNVRSQPLHYYEYDWHQDTKDTCGTGGVDITGNKTNGWFFRFLIFTDKTTMKNEILYYIVVWCQVGANDCFIAICYLFLM